MAVPRRGINLVNEAFGLNQLVPLLVALSITPPDSVIGIEEPEIHLHPKAQAALCDIFVDIVMHERKQIIITTHSEHILMSLLTSVAKGKMQPTDLAVYELQRQEDIALAERLEVNQFGQIAGGLKGFLETDLDEIGDLIKARFSQKNK
jgi:predicted ATPase